VNALFEAASALQDVCEAHAWQYCFIGGLAVLRWGEPRETIDVDLTLLTGFGTEAEYVRVLTDAFAARVENPMDFALTYRVLLLRSTSGVGLDISLAGLPFEAGVIARSTVFTYPPAFSLRTCSAEDLIVYKAFADRAKDWADIEGMVIRNAWVDWVYIDSQLAPLAELKAAPHILERLAELRQRFGGS
jgi:hypothetical protein